MFFSGIMLLQGGSGPLVLWVPDQLPATSLARLHVSSYQGLSKWLATPLPTPKIQWMMGAPPWCRGSSARSRRGI